MKHLMQTALFITAFSIVTGCASMFSGSEQTIVIKTTEGTEVYIDDRYAGTGYVKRKVSRDEPHIIRVESKDCQRSITTQAEFNKMSLLGLMLDAGLISIPTDFATGAAWQVYPDRIQLNPECEKAALN